MLKKQPLILRELDFFILPPACPRQNSIMLNFFRKIIFLSLILHAAESLAQDKGSKSGLFQRASQRETKRWTLQEWLETKERNRMMDLWLAINTPSPYEGMLGLAHHNHQTKASPTDTGTSYSHLSGQASAYATLIGLTFEFSKHEKENFNDTSGMLNLRLFGNSIQTTAITLHFGQRTRTINLETGDQVLRNNFGQISLQLYLNKHFGLDGSYRQYLSAKDAVYGDVTGQLSEAGIFIDFKALRIFGSWYQDVQINNLNQTETKIERNGIKSGLRIFF